MRERKGLTETQIWVPFAIAVAAFGLGLSGHWIFGTDGATVGYVFIVIGCSWLTLTGVYHIGKAVGSK